MKSSQNEQKQSTTLIMDDVFKKIGEFGYYQFLILISISLTAIIPAILAYSYIFIGATPSDYRCHLQEYLNDTYEIQSDYHKSLIDKYIPLVQNELKYDKCRIISISNETIKCNKWVFSKKYYEKTIVTDWNLVCDNVARKSTFSTLYFVGTYGVLLAGILSDKYGRQLTAYLFILFNAIFNIASALVLNLTNSQSTQIAFGILRFLIGITSNVYAIAVVIAVEITGPGKRVFAANFVYYFYIIGEYMTCLISYFIRDYKQLYVFFSVIMSCFIFYFWAVPESPRWLLANKKSERAFKTLKRVAKSNKKVLPESYEILLLENISTKSEAKLTPEKNVEQLSLYQALKVIIRTRVLLMRTIAIVFNWLTNNLVYYGLTLGTGELQWGSPYLNFALSTSVELIAIICSQFCFNKYGRKIPYVVNMSVAGLTLLAVIFVPKNYPQLITLIALIGKFSISLTYNGIYIITAETYPTFIRNTAVSVSQSIARIGAVIAPYINLLSEVYWYPATFIIYGIFSLIASLLTIFYVVETQNLKLPETLEELCDKRTESNTLCI